MNVTVIKCVGLLESVAAISFALVAADSKSQSNAKSEKGHAHAAHAEVPDRAIAVLHPTKGNDKIQGWVKFVQTDEGVEITAQVKGLTPGKHGFHIHEFGDLTAADGTSAGAHFNPTGEKHGGPHDQQRHDGDLGNLEAGEDGVAEYRFVDKEFKLHTIFGRSIVVHAGEDDLKSQPSGDSGDRIAVGVIGVAQKPKTQAASAEPTSSGQRERRTASRIPLPDVKIDASEQDVRLPDIDTEPK